jgi:succinyl-diaminopimelate desuccinylase
MPDTSKGDPVQLLQTLIRCPSVTPEAAGVFEVLEAALEPLGFTTVRLRFDGDGSYPVDNLFATRGSRGKHLLFAGHTDVVPPGDVASWTYPPFAGDIADGKIFGRGAADMKSGIVAFIAAASRAIANGEADKGIISLAITNDEEADSINGTEKLLAWAADQGHRFDFAIVGEPSSAARLGDRIKIGRRGSLNGRIVVAGVQGHVAYPEKANNPVPVLATVVASLNGKLDDGSAHFSASNLEFTSVDVGNETANVIPARAVARFNIRYNDGWTPEALEASVREHLAGLEARGCSIDFEVLGRPSRSFLWEPGEAVETLCRTIERVTGSRPELSTAGGTSDARFIAQYCPVVECGLPGPSMHKTDEHVALADVEGLAALYGAFIADYFA